MRKTKGEDELRERGRKWTDRVVRDAVEVASPHGRRGELEGVETGPFVGLVRIRFLHRDAVVRGVVRGQSLLCGERDERGREREGRGTYFVVAQIELGNGTAPLHSDCHVPRIDLHLATHATQRFSDNLLQFWRRERGKKRRKLAFLERRLGPERKWRRSRFASTVDVQPTRPPPPSSPPLRISFACNQITLLAQSQRNCHKTTTGASGRSRQFKSSIPNPANQLSPKMAVENALCRRVVPLPLRHPSSLPATKKTQLPLFAPTSSKNTRL